MTKKEATYNKIGTTFFIAGILFLFAMLAVLYSRDKSSANALAKETTVFIEGSCDNYDNTRLDYYGTASEMVRESADTLASCTQSSQLQDSDYLLDYASAQKMSGILILDENLSLVNQVNTENADGYKLWYDLIWQTNKNSISKYPDKSYIAQITKDDRDYAIAMVSRTDAAGIIVCYADLTRLSTDHYANSFTSILENNTFHKNPTIVITDGTKILASNAKNLKALTTVQNPYKDSDRRAWNHKELLHMRMGWKSWYGTRTVYGKYHIFVFYPAGEIFSNIPLAVAFSLAAFAILILFFVLIRQHFTKENLKKEERQLQKVRAIGSLYSSMLLLHLDTYQFELLKLSGQMAQLINGNTDARKIYQLVHDHLIAPDSQDAFQEFLSLDGLTERIGQQASASQVFQTTDGTWYSCYIIPESCKADGTPLTVLVISRDISEYKIKEEAFQNELRKTARDADMANAVKTTFLRRMSHDVRTPINGIQGMAEIAGKNLENPTTVKECLNRIMSSSSYLLDLVNDVLRMSKLESGNILLEEKPFYFQNVLMETASFIEIQAQQKGVTFSANCRHDSGKLLLGSPLHIRQILQNIMSNAIKYTPAGGSVTVTAQEIRLTETAASYEIFCTDTGIGMSKEFQAHAFEPFVQEDDSARTTFAGVGLGLSIVKDLVDRMHGSIHFTSEQGKGTTFVITLTFQLDPSCRQELPGPEEVPDFDADCDDRTLALDGIHILVAEDNELNMEIAKYLLSDCGAHVTEAHNGQEALDLFQLSKPGTYDIILMDIMMPVMDGLESAKKIRALRRSDAGNIPIFAMTANAFVEDIRQSVQAGMNEHLTKPLDIDQLIEKIQKYCHKKS